MNNFILLWLGYFESICVSPFMLVHLTFFSLYTPTLAFTCPCFVIYLFTSFDLPYSTLIPYCTVLLLESLLL